MGNGSDEWGPVEVSGKGEFLRAGLFDIAVKYAFDFTFENGLKMICTSDGPRGIKFDGEDGWIFIHIHGGHLEASSPGLLKETIGADEIHLGRSPGHHANFLQCVRTRALPVANAEIGHRTATMCHLANIAMQTGRTIKWDPAREIITNDEEASKMCARPMRAPWTLA
jgi:hypothetical protein